MTPMEITLAGKVVSLELSSKALRRVSSYFGGMVPACRAMYDLDTEAMRKILAAGLNKPLADDDGLDAAIYEHGAVALQDGLLQYLDKLSTGGKGSPKPASDGDK